MAFNKTLTTLLLASTLSLAGCEVKPSIQRKADVTGDNIEDIFIEIPAGNAKPGTYLFIGQKDGSFTRLIKCTADDGTNYFLTDDKKAYFFDGKAYVEAKPEKQAEKNE